MLYPFNILELGYICGLREEKHDIGQEFEVDSGWVLKKFESKSIRSFVDDLGLSIHTGAIFLSCAKECAWHIDRFKYHRLMHRILIPKSDNFSWFFLNRDGKEIETKPTAFKAYLFNNMVPHRFASTDKNIREVIYLDVFDPAIKSFIDNCYGDNREFNKSLSLLNADINERIRGDT
jgi:hypothetical protein